MTPFSPLVLYSLKRQYGVALDLYKLTASQTDVRTGVTTVTKTVYHIPRAIALPVGWSRARMPSISSANKDYVAGGSRDTNTRDFIVDKKDAVGLTALTADDWVVYQGVQYQVSKVETFDNGWIVTTSDIGEVPEQTFGVNLDNRVAAASEVDDG